MTDTKAKRPQISKEIINDCVTDCHYQSIFTTKVNCVNLTVHSMPRLHIISGCVCEGIFKMTLVFEQVVSKVDFLPIIQSFIIRLHRTRSGGKRNLPPFSSLTVQPEHLISSGSQGKTTPPSSLWMANKGLLPICFSKDP